jgi:hypothetical protein
VIVEGTYLLTPAIPALAEHGPLAAYQLRIELSAAYPAVEPEVSETGGAFPHDADHHVFENGRCCLLVWEHWIATADDTSLRAFFDGPLRNYFLGQYAVAQGQDWPFGERAHGAKGLADAYAERLGCGAEVRAVKVFLKGLLKIHGRDALPVYWRCPCESGRNIGQCCAALLERLRREIALDELELMLERLVAATRPPVVRAARRGAR